MEIAVFSGIDKASANWLMIAFSSSSITPSASAISTAQAKAAVSYTHLTLPTILLV